ncbi:MAG: SAM-dependent methyltransferase, partial [Myxococcales bacterium]|nr:SAM-dependent methyltransferase [Myxococcales bacterium]
RSSIRRLEIGSTVYPSPGGVQEEVRAVFVEIEPCFVQRPLVNRSGFSASGVVRAIEGRQLLRAAQVGGLPDARLELSTYDLLRRRGIDPGPWIGEQIDLLGASPDKPLAATPTPLDDLWSRPSRRRFRPVESARSSGFLDVRAATFDELACDASTVASQTLEFVVPTRLSPNTAVVAPLLRLDGRVAIGVDDDDLPAAQCFTGNSELLVAPAWRLPKAQIGLRRTRAFLAEKLRAEYGLEARRLFRLGGSYYPSAGQTPEVAHPFVADIFSIQAGALRTLRWIDLAQLVQHAERLRDGHLAVIVRRAAHALAL